MKKLEELSLFELKAYRELLEKRILGLHQYKIGNEYHPPYTEKDINDFKIFEKQAEKTLLVVNKKIRVKLDEFISSIDLD